MHETYLFLFSSVDAAYRLSSRHVVGKRAQITVVTTSETCYTRQEHPAPLHVAQDGPGLFALFAILKDAKQIPKESQKREFRAAIYALYGENVQVRHTPVSGKLVATNYFSRSLSLSI